MKFWPELDDCLIIIESMNNEYLSAFHASILYLSNTSLLIDGVDFNDVRQRFYQVLPLQDFRVSRQKSFERF